MYWFIMEYRQEDYFLLINMKFIASKPAVDKENNSSLRKISEIIIEKNFLHITY